MHVFINDREIQTGAHGGATVGEIVEASRMHVDPREIVTAVVLDGVEINAGDEPRYARRAAGSVERLVIRTASPAAFTADKRRSLVGALDQVAERTRIVVVLLREAETRAANGLLANLMEEVRLSMLLDYQLALLASDAPSEARQAIADLAPALLDAEERRAWDTLAGLLDTRLAPIIEGWAASTRARLDAGASSAAAS